MSDQIDKLKQKIVSYLDVELPALVHAAASKVAARFPNSDAVLFYGSCLRTGKIDGQMLDFYVLVEDYRGAYGSKSKAFGNSLIPPNVFYFEEEIDGVIVRAKFAVLSTRHFLKLCSEEAFNPAVWARFAQPIALSWCKDDGAKNDVLEALATALQTLAKSCVPLMQGAVSERDFWTFCFAQTYRTELRAESSGRPEQLYDLMSGFYSAMTPDMVADLEGVTFKDGVLHIDIDRTQRLRANWIWFWRRVQGKLIHVLRLIKGAATFDGGIEYLAWKIERHSGVKVILKPWHRKYPVLAGIYLLPRLRHKGAVK